MTKQMTVSEAAVKWDISEQRIRQWLDAGRIRGAKRFGWAWAIPATAKRPKKLRGGNGKKR